jgi:SAM-dependent methyltransferase
LSLEHDELDLKCTGCDSTYSFKNGYLNLLPPKIRKEICTRGILERKIKDKLHMGHLSKNEQDLVKGILASKYMAKQYFRNVVHPTQAAWSARSYERFEDIFIISYLDGLLKNKEVTFIDAGSGPGRYLILLGSKIGINSCKELKRNSETSTLYKYDKMYDKNLRNIVGIDYSEEMVSHSTRLLKKYGLDQYLYERIFPIAGIIQNFHLNQQLDRTHKVIVCTFQTLGNQENTDLQVQLLESMKSLALPHGTIIVSVFNKKLFKDFGLKTFYGREVKQTVGEIINSKQDEDNSILRTTKGVYSKWFSKHDLEQLFKKANISNYKIMDENSLQPVTGYEQYLKVEEQCKDVFPRAIVGLAEVS